MLGKRFLCIEEEGTWSAGYRKSFIKGTIFGLEFEFKFFDCLQWKHKVKVNHVSFQLRSTKTWGHPDNVIIRRMSRWFPHLYQLWVSSCQLNKESTLGPPRRKRKRRPMGHWQDWRKIAGEVSYWISLAKLKLCFPEFLSCMIPGKQWPQGLTRKVKVKQHPLISRLSQGMGTTAAHAHGCWCAHLLVGVEQQLGGSSSSSYQIFSFS